MRFRRSSKGGLRRREPRADAFRSGDLVKVIRAELAPWLKEQGFKRLGSNGWIRPSGEQFAMVVVQCSQSGWDDRSGNKFVIEFEQSREPRRGTGSNRDRIWYLLDELSRHEALNINTRVAQTLPPPDMQFVNELPAGIREHYLASFGPSTETNNSSDVWFKYYDETDAAIWAEFLKGRIGPVLENFLARPASIFRISQ